MTKWILILVSGAMLGGVFFLRAADVSAAPRPLCDDQKKTSPDVIESKPKEPRKTNAGPAKTEWEKRLEKMTPEEREAKRRELKERLEKRIADLRGKQTNGTITAQETRELERREQILKRFELATPGVKPDSGPKIVPASQ